MVALAAMKLLREKGIIFVGLAAIYLLVSALKDMEHILASPIFVSLLLYIFSLESKKLFVLKKPSRAE